MQQLNSECRNLNCIWNCILSRFWAYYYSSVSLSVQILCWRFVDFRFPISALLSVAYRCTYYLPISPGQLMWHGVAANKFSQWTRRSHSGTLQNRITKSPSDRGTNITLGWHCQLQQTILLSTIHSWIPLLFFFCHRPPHGVQNPCSNYFYYRRVYLGSFPHVTGEHTRRKPRFRQQRFLVVFRRLNQ